MQTILEAVDLGVTKLLAVSATQNLIFWMFWLDNDTVRQLIV